MGRVGIVLGLEVSRLARNSSDWHRLLEICALADTLILDEDGVYNPKEFNDRLLLGLKGQMSEAEIFMSRRRAYTAASSAKPCAVSYKLRCRQAWCTTLRRRCSWIPTSRCKRWSASCLRPLSGRDRPRRR